MTQNSTEVYEYVEEDNGIVDENALQTKPFPPKSNNGGSYSLAEYLQKRDADKSNEVPQVKDDDDNKDMRDVEIVLKEADEKDDLLESKNLTSSDKKANNNGAFHNESD